MALSLSCSGSFSSDGESMYFEDSTGTYSLSNTGGWNSPNPATTSVTTFQVICNWLSAGATVTYNFTVSSGTITVATVTDNEGTTANILADLASTAFPIVDPNFLDLTDDFDDAIVLPTLEDGQFQLIYKVIGVSGGAAYTYTTSTTYFRITDLCCCLKELRLTAEADCPCSDSVITRVNKIEFWLQAALCAVDVGKPNDIALDYFTLAQQLCDSDCGCS